MTTEAEIRQALENEDQICVGPWCWCGLYMSCDTPGCCDESYQDIDEAFDAIKRKSSKSDFADVEIDNANS